MTDQEPQDPLSDPIVDPLFDHAPAHECSPELARQIAGKLASSLTPVKPMPSAAVLALRVALVYAALAVGLTWMMGVSAFRSLTALQALGIGAVLAAGVALFSVGLAWQMRPGSFQRIPAKLSWAIFGAAFVAGAALLLPLRGTEAFVLDGWPCLVTGLAAAAGSAMFFWWMARSGVAVSAGSFGGMLGAMAGLVGVTVLQFRCPYQNAGHVAVWHGGVFAMAISLGAAVFVWADHNRNQPATEA